MAEPWDTYAERLAASLGLTPTSEQLAACSELLFDITPEPLQQLRESMTLLGRWTGAQIIETDGPPSEVVGSPRSIAIDLAELKIYGPKDETTGWGAGRSMVGASLFDIWKSLPGNEDGTESDFLEAQRGATGAAGEITSVSITAGTPGSGASIVVGGTASARTIALTIATGLTGATPNLTVGTVTTGAAGSDVAISLTGTTLNPVLNITIPRGNTGTTGDTGAVPNVSAEVNIIASDGTPTVTRSGPDASPHFVFNLPAPVNGIDGRELELNDSPTHLQYRYSGDTDWIDLAPKSDFQGEKGDKGDGLQVDKVGANLAARDAWDGEAEGFTFLDDETGLLYFRVGAVAGAWSGGSAFGTTLNAVLEALGSLSSSTGILVQTGATTFAKLAIGVAAGSSIPDRDAGDTRWRRNGVDIAMSEITGLSTALGEKADAGAVLSALAAKQDASDNGTAFAALTFATGKLMYATGPHAFALTDLTTAAMTLLAQTSQGAMRTTGLGMSANGSSLVAAADYAAMRALLGSPVLTVNGAAPDGAGNIVVAAGDYDVDFMLAAIFQARTAGGRVAMVRGIADDFQDTTGIDAALSTGELYVSAGTKAYKGRYAPLAAMTSNSAPSPQVASASSAFAGASAFEAFDADLTSNQTSIWWPSSSGDNTAWLKRRLDTARRVTSYKILVGPNASGLGDGHPQTWTLQGSNDDSTWTTVDTVSSGQTFANSEEKTFTVDTPGTYLYYKLQMSAAYGYCGICQLTFIDDTVADASLITVAETAVTAPSSSRILLLASAAIVAGTNLRGYLTRNDGANWTEATLTSLGTVDGRNILTGVADLTGQPSGTAPRARVDTFASGGADILIEAIAHKWAA